MVCGHRPTETSQSSSPSFTEHRASWGVTDSNGGGLCCGLGATLKQTVKRVKTYFLQGAGITVMGLWELATGFGGCRHAGSETTGVKLLR